MGLYVIGRPDPELRQLENAIFAEKRTNQLRTVSVHSLLSLADILSEYDVTHADVVQMLWPQSVGVDPLIDVMSRLVAQSGAEQQPALSPAGGSENTSTDQLGPSYWVTPVKDHEAETASECIEKLVGKLHIYAFGERTPGRRRMKVGDWICFYANGVGVVAHARLASAPERKPHPQVLEPDRFPYTVRVDSQHVYTSTPVIVDGNCRSELSAFKDRDPERPWAWFVQATRRIAQADFGRLTKPHGAGKAVS